MFKRLSLKAKIMLCGALGVFALIVNQMVVLKQLSAVKSIGLDLSDYSIPAVSKVDELRIAITTIHGSYAEALTSKAGEIRKKVESQIEESSGNLFIYRKTFEPLIRDAETQSFYDTFSTEWDLFVSKCDEMMKVRDEDPAKFQGIWTEANSHYARAEAALTKVSTKSYEAAVATSQIFQKIYSNTVKMLVAAFLICFFGVIFSVWAFSAKLSNTLAHIVGSITESGSAVNGATSQLAVAGEQVASGATSAASSIEETVASLEEITSMVRINSENASQAAKLANRSSEIAANGSTEVSALVTSIREIAASSRKIEDIINVIEDIAFQTNILSLNAAVEAARAGEEGKGFAVVAEAVRGLAQRSATAAKEISSLIRESVQKIETGTRHADASGSVLKEILNSTIQVAKISTEIAGASQEQSHGLTQISKAMNEIDGATQQNAATSSEVAQSATDLFTQADNLNKVVDSLRLVIYGSKSQTIAEFNQNGSKDHISDEPNLNPMKDAA